MEQDIMMITSAAATVADGDDTAVAAADPAPATEAGDMPTASFETAKEETASPAAEMTYLPVYNGEVRPVKAADREEVTTLLQLGMKQREFLPVYEQLKRLAGDAGAASVKAFVEQLYDAEEHKRLETAIAQFGEEHGRHVYELEREQRGRRYTELVKQQQEQQQREEIAREQHVAREFAQLRREYPQFTDIRDLPPSVVAQAADEHIALIDAYNRFVLAEQRRTHREAAAGKAAAAVSTGSLAQQSGETVSVEKEAFLRGLYSRM